MEDFKIHINLLKEDETVYRLYNLNGFTKVCLIHPLKYTSKTVNILTRITSFEDVLILKQVIEILKVYKKECHVFVTYYSLHSDQEFKEYDNIPLYELVLDFIKPLNKISFLCPISKISEDCDKINGFFVIFNKYLRNLNVNIIKNYLLDFRYLNGIAVSSSKVFAMDKKYTQDGETFEVKGISKFNSGDETVLFSLDELNVIKVHDILREKSPNSKISLIIIHVKDYDTLKELSKKFCKIYTTNSVQNFGKYPKLKNVEIMDCEELINLSQKLPF